METQEKNGGPNFLREWRTFRHMTQAELASAVDTSTNMIQYLETGERGLSAKWLRRLADALDTTPGMLLEHDPNEMDSDIVDIWATLSNRDRRQAAAIIKTFKTGTDD